MPRPIESGPRSREDEEKLAQQREQTEKEAGDIAEIRAAGKETKRPGWKKFLGIGKAEPKTMDVLQEQAVREDEARANAAQKQEREENRLDEIKTKLFGRSNPERADIGKVAGMIKNDEEAVVAFKEAGEWDVEGKLASKVMDLCDYKEFSQMDPKKQEQIIKTADKFSKANFLREAARTVPSTEEALNMAENVGDFLDEGLYNREKTQKEAVDNLVLRGVEVAAYKGDLFKVLKEFGGKAGSDLKAQIWEKGVGLAQNVEDLYEIANLCGVSDSGGIKVKTSLKEAQRRFEEAEKNTSREK